MANQPTRATETKHTNKKANYVWAVGRRKRAVARVRLYEKDKRDEAVDILVNDQPVGKYFHNPVARLTYGQPLELTKTLDKYRITAKIAGSGLESQLEALKHGISRALIKADSSYKALLKPYGLLTRDPRERQKRMIGKGGRARAKKQSPKR